MPREYQILILAMTVVWLGCALVPGPVRRALINGLHCLSRYPDLWRIPAIFAAAHGLYSLLADLMFLARTESGLTGEIFDIRLQPLPALPQALAESWLAALEATAANLTIFTTTMPLSALAALVFLLNQNRLLAEIARAIMRRFPRAGLLVVVLLVLSALAALAYPLVFLFMPEVSAVTTFYGVLGIAALATVFDLLLGVYFLTCLMLMAYAWIRGMQFHRPKLLRVAARRTGFALKWSLVLAGATLFLAILPQNLGLVLADVLPAFANFLHAFGAVAGPCVVFLAALVLFPVQAVLVFHNESLRAAIGDSLGFVRKNAAVVLPFVSVIFVTALAVALARHIASGVLSPGTIFDQGAGIALQSLGAALAGWFIAAWVCLYKSRFSARNEIPF